MKIKLIMLFIVLLSLSFVSATTFKEDTTFTEGNINYIFKADMKIDDFSLAPAGIKINSVEKYGFVVEGGEFTVTFYDIDDISFKSSVPQKIEFNIASNGNKQFLYNGERYYHSSIDIGVEEIRFNLTSFKEQNTLKSVSTTNFGDKVNTINWWEQKLFEFEVDTYVDDVGIIHNKTVSVTYLLFTLSMMFIVVGATIWNIYRK